MYENVGQKIKGFSETLAGLGIISSLIVGLYLVFGLELVVFGIMYSVIGCVGSWVLGLFMSGFGSLVEDVREIASSVSHNSSNLADSGSRCGDTGMDHPKWATSTYGNLLTEKHRNNENPTEGWVCKSCGKTNATYVGTCSCGEEKS